MASVIVIPVQRKKGPGWKVQWREAGGDQSSRTLGTQQEAEDFAAIKKGELVSGTSFNAKPGKISFADYWEGDYVPHYLSKGRSPKTKASYESYYRNLLEPFFGSKPLNGIEKSTLKDWVDWCERGAGKKRTPSAHSVKQAFVVLRSALSCAVSDGIIQLNPCANMGRILPDLPPERKPVVLTIPEVRALAGAVAPRYRALILLLGTHGPRPSEALALTVGDVHLNEGYIWIDKAAVNVRGIMTYTPNTKNRRPRRVELFSFTREALAEHMNDLGQLEDDTLLFPGKLSGKYLHMDYLRTLVKEAGEGLGFNGMTTYDLKRSAATNLLIKTNIKYAQEQLGHSRYSMSLLYAQVTRGMSAGADEAMTAAFNGEVSGQEGTQKAS